MNIHEKANEVRAYAVLQGSRPGLERIRELLERMGNPQDQIPVIHVAGTNGKGSTCAFLESIFRSAGYKTGLFTSPFLLHPTEMFRIEGTPISDEEFDGLTIETGLAATGMEALPCNAPTEFEVYTAMAFTLFVQKECQIVVIETGMGGLLDATNVCKQPLLSIITRISLEHQAFLGHDILSIARHKAGILREGGTALFGPQEPVVKLFLHETSKTIHAEIVPETDIPCKLQHITLRTMQFSCGDCGLLETKLLGVHQMENALLAMRAAEILSEKGWNIRQTHIRQGILEARWPCRFEVVSEMPPVVIDSAHNPDGMRTFVDTYSSLFQGQKAVVLFGVMKDKDVAQMLEQLAPLAACMVVVKPDHSRAMELEDLYQLANQACENVSKSDTIEKAVKMCISLRISQQPIVVVGSIYYVGQVSHLLKQANHSFGVKNDQAGGRN